jgi:hypothetical protein
VPDPHPINLFAFATLFEYEAEAKFQVHGEDAKRRQRQCLAANLLVVVCPPIR